MDQRAMIKKYFEKPPNILPAIVCIFLIGSFFLILAVWWLGLLICGIAVWAWFYYSSTPRGATDEEIDQWIEDDIRRLYARALSKTSVDESELVGDPVRVVGFRFWSMQDCFVGFRKGADHVMRFTPLSVTIINFTADQLLSYSCVLDLTTGNPLNESTDEYFYRDVVSVSTQTKTHTWHASELPRNAVATLQGIMTNNTIQLRTAETFMLTTAGGTSIEVVLTDPGLIRQLGGAEATIPTTMSERALKSVRKMLREKKTV